MNQEDILKMAREAGFQTWESKSQCSLGKVFVQPIGWYCNEELERFAAMVAEKAAQDEREACAKRCEEKSDYWLGQCDTTSAALQGCAISLRARGR